MLKLSTAVLGLVLLFSAVQAYPFKPIQRVDELKIPYCLEQRGFKCRVCGYNEDLKTFTAPNVIQTACLPSANGCAQFKDLTGTVCDSNYYCTCGFSRNYFGVCVPSPTGLENCAVLDITGTRCTTCVGWDTLQNGGGLGDYGKSFDSTKCIDNTATNKPNCASYKVGDTECAQCQTQYAFNSAGVCIRLKTTNNYCELADDTGVCIQCFANAVLQGSGQCNPLPLRDNNCIQFAKLSNGLDNKAKCIQCNAGYINTLVGCQQIPSNIDNGIDLETGIEVIDLGQWCLAGVRTFNNKYQCSILLSRKSEFVSKPVAEPIVINNCNADKYNAVARTCESQKECNVAYADRNTNNNAWFFNKNTNQCLLYNSGSTIPASIASTCIAVANCKVSDGFGACLTCHLGYGDASGNPVNGFCKLTIPVEGCKELNADGKTCQTCYSSYETVDGFRWVHRFYRLNPETNTCDQIINDVFTERNCLKIDDNALCTQCRENYTLANGWCNLSVPNPATPRAAPGSKAYAESGDAEALPGFVCKGNNCTQKDYSHNCLVFSADGKNCQTCILPHYVIVYNQLTQNWDKCELYGSAGDLTTIGCLQRSSSCSKCDTCKAGYNYVTRSATATGYQSQAGCFRSDTAAETLIDGCVVYTSATACQVCGFGYLKTADNQCYDLYARRVQTNSLGLINDNGIVATIPEPCSAASTIYTCTALNTTLSADIALRKFSAAVFAASGEFDRAHVFYNGDLINNFIILGGAAQLKLQRGCKTYADEPDATLENSCTAVYDGYAIATVNSIGYAYNTATQTGSNVSPADYNCKAGAFNGATLKCTSCNVAWVLDATTGQCVSLGISDCVQGTLGTPNNVCTQCAAGFELSIRASGGGTQCHNTYNYGDDKNSGGCGYFQCATNQISVTWTLNVPSYTPTCQALYDVQNNYCVSSTKIEPNGDKLNEDTGNFQTCQAGYVLILDNLALSNRVVQSGSFDRSNLLAYRCVPRVDNCSDIRSNGQCEACASDPVTGATLVPDSSGSVCIQFNNPLRNVCKKFDLNKKDVCLECFPGKGTPADGCKLNPNCNGFETYAPNTCNSCESGYFLNYQRECIKSWYGVLDGCTTAYNATTCLECDSGYVLVTNQDNDEAGDIGVCRQEIAVQGCAHYNAAREKCLRCQDNWAWLNGICIPNDSGNFPLLAECAEYKYDTDKKNLYCSECARGFAIDGNYTRCITNTHKCSDISGGNDCSLIKQLKPYNTAFECDTYRSSANLLATAALFLSFILLALF